MLFFLFLYFPLYWLFAVFWYSYSLVFTSPNAKYINIYIYIYMYVCVCSCVFCCFFFFLMCFFCLA